MLNVQAAVTPVIALGCAGTVVGITANVLIVPFPQVFDGITLTFPELPFVVTVTELLVPPEV